MKTEKLYYKDSMLHTFECRVLDSEQTDGGYKIILDKTAFFPEGGGQKSDTGMIGNASVFDVQEVNGEIYHFTDKPLNIGNTYTAHLNFDERFDKMQNHTGEHIVSGIAHDKYGCENVGFHLSENIVTLDFDKFLNREQLNELERLANIVIQKNVSVFTCFPDKKELKNIKYRSKLDLSEDVRLVEIEGTDICACCAPHVTSTGQVGSLKLLQSEKYKGGIRIVIKCGMRAVLDYQDKYANISEISSLLCAKQEECADAVKQLKDEKSQLEYEITRLKRNIIDIKLSALTSTDNNICIIEQSLSTDDMRYFANNAVGLCNVFAVFSQSNGRYNFICASNKTDMLTVANRLRQILSAKCGGNEQMIQGSITADEQQIKDFFNNKY